MQANPEPCTIPTAALYISLTMILSKGPAEWRPGGGDCAFGFWSPRKVTHCNSWRTRAPALPKCTWSRLHAICPALQLCLQATGIYELDRQVEEGDVVKQYVEAPHPRVPPLPMYAFLP
mmetsp:Transcript_142381/g.248304  ORF Transcript_142381/g.248304 Transcript_142381/m.248304 type:complete len:119 (-) Transcript_142381:441-797(-)